MFDSDEPGQKAAHDVATKLRVKPGKIKVASLPLKDANEMLRERRSKELIEAIWAAALVRPDGIINGNQLWEIVSQPLERGLSYPWARLNEMTYGQRPRELTVWTAGTGVGKSQFIREVAHDLVTRHGQKVGILSLEESVREAALGQMSLAANARLHIPEERDKVPEEDFRKAYEATLGSGDYEFYDHFGSVSADEIIPKLRYLAVACGCKWLILDHISIMISGMAADGDERKRIDELMTRLRSLAEELNVGMHVVSHVRKAKDGAFEEGAQISLTDLRGSGSIAQIGNTVIAIERNQQAKTEVRNRSNLRVLKNRFAGTTGHCGQVEYTAQGRLVEKDALPLKEQKSAEDKREF
jgi:twinkle protein